MATANSSGAPVRADHPVDSDPSLTEALRRARIADAQMSPARPLPVESGARRRAMNVRKV